MHATDDLTTRSAVMVARAAADMRKPPLADCSCFACDGSPSLRMRLYGCSCGNKRCPHGTDHRLACTGSNEPGQMGSVYGVHLTEAEITARVHIRLLSASDAALARAIDAVPGRG